MVAQKQDTALTLDCKVECREKHYFVVGTFQIPISSTFDVHELDQIEAEIEIICRTSNGNSPGKCSKPPIVGLPKLSKLPTRIFTSTAHVPSPSSQGTAQ